MPTPDEFFAPAADPDDGAAVSPRVRDVPVADAPEAEDGPVAPRPGDALQDVDPEAHPELRKGDPAEAAPEDEPAPAPQLPGSHVADDELTLTFPDPDHALASVRLWAHLTTPLEHDYTQVPGGWMLTQPLPDLDRLEYLVEITDAAGDTTLGPDPTQPQRVGSAFGDHSWLPMPGYAPPAWAGAGQDPHHREAWTLESHESLGGDGAGVGELRAHVLSPADTGPADVLPMLLAHDGPEMEQLGELVTCLDALAREGRAPRLRIALLEPGDDRNARYSADPAYAQALATAAGVLSTRWPTPAPPVLLGASLGALAALHAEWLHPGTFAGLFLASGSFFTPELDAGEADFPHWDAITAFTAGVAEAGEPPSRPAVAIVCGTAEENHENNLALREHLHRLGLDVPPVTTVRDGHCYTCWRDLLDPALPDLLARAWN